MNLLSGRKSRRGSFSEEKFRAAERETEKLIVARTLRGSIAAQCGYIETRSELDAKREQLRKDLIAAGKLKE